MTNRDQVIIMYETVGFTRKQIAKRLCCTLRHINRILKDKTRAQNEAHKHIDTEHEFVLWAQWLVKTDNYSVVAFMFAVSRQHIWAKLNDVTQEAETA